MEVEKQKMVVQMNLELVERQKALSEANQDKLNNLVQKHKTENADMVEYILDNADDEAKEAVEEAKDDDGVKEAVEEIEAADQAPAAPETQPRHACSSVHQQLLYNKFGIDLSKLERLQ